MNLSDILQALADEGASPAMLVAAARAAEVTGLNEIAARRSKDALRQKRRRERMRSRDGHVTPREKTKPAEVDLDDWNAGLPSKGSRDGHDASREAKDGVPPIKKGLPRTPSKEINPLPDLPLDLPHLDSPSDYPRNAFPLWWSGYPHKVGKLKAAESFRRVRQRRKATFAELIEGRDRYIRDKPADRPWLNPATFLNQGRWGDQPADVAGQGVDPGRSDRVLQALKGRMGDGERRDDNAGDSSA